MKRWDDLDIAKGFAISLLIIGVGRLNFEADVYTEQFGGAYASPSGVSLLLRVGTTYVAAMFFLLSGMLIGRRMTERPEERDSWAQHLFGRGLFLIAIDPLITQLYNLSHPPNEYFLIAEVMTAFGLAFIAIAVLRNVRSSGLLALAIALWLATEFLAPRFEADDSALGLLGALFLDATKHPNWQVEYTLAGWLPFLLIGVVAGRHFAQHGPPKPKVLAQVGLASIATFVFLRLVVGFGAVGQAKPETLVEFWQPTRYPVSIQYALWSMGVASIGLAIASVVAERWPQARLTRALRIFGKQPLMAYLFTRILASSIQAVAEVRERDGSTATGAAISLLIWFLAMGTCYWWDQFKRRHRTRFPLLGFV